MKNIDDQVKALLRQAGLSKSEITVYLAGLQTGAVGSAVLVEAIGLPRVTVQLALKELVQIGACKSVPHNGRSFMYEMLPPSSLKVHLGQKIQDISAVIDQLDRIVITPESHMVQAREAYGQLEVQKLLELALQCKDREWRIIAPRKNALTYMPQSYIQHFKQTRKTRQITSKTLWESQFKDTDINLRELLMRKPRFVPESSGKIPAMLIAFDNSLLSIEGGKQPSAVLIESPQAVKTFQIVFDLAWQACRPTKG